MWEFNETVWEGGSLAPEWSDNKLEHQIRYSNLRQSSWLSVIQSILNSCIKTK